MGWGVRNGPPFLIMFASNFISKLRKIDPRFNLDFSHRVGSSDEGSAGLYLEDKYICGCPQGSMPERTLMDNFGRVIVRGWKDLLDILIQKRFISNSKSFKYFGYYR